MWKPCEVTVVMVISTSMLYKSLLACRKQDLSLISYVLIVYGL